MRTGLKAMHAEKISQMEGEMERMRRDKTCVDQEIGQLRADLKGDERTPEWVNQYFSGASRAM